MPHSKQNATRPIIDYSQRSTIILAPNFLLPCDHWDKDGVCFNGDCATEDVVDQFPVIGLRQTYILPQQVILTWVSAMALAASPLYPVNTLVPEQGSYVALKHHGPEVATSSVTNGATNNSDGPPPLVLGNIGTGQDVNLLASLGRVLHLRRSIGGDYVLLPGALDGV